MNSPPKRRWLQFSLRRLLVVVSLLCIGPGGYIAYEQRKARREEAAVRLLKELGGTQVYSSPHWLRRLIDGSESGHVVGLSLHSPQVTDASLVSFPSLPELIWLDLNDTPITDAGLVHLTKLRKLKRLRLDETNITDGGLRQLAQLTRLETLNLSRTKITDAGLAQLSTLQNLETLDLQKSQVTDGGVAELKKALPNCAINR